MRRTSGVSLMLLIFLSLCLIIFSLLSLSGATADEKLSQKSADRTTEYYAAVTKANEQLALIDEQLAAFLKEAENTNASANAESLYDRLCSQISDFLPDVSWSDGTMTFSVPVTDSQILEAILSVEYPAADSDSLYRITSWKVINTQEWHPDTSLNLFHSNSFDY